MADERELQEQGVGVGTGDSTESAPSTAEPVVQPTAPKVNLNDFEEYRKEQAARDRQLAAEKRAREQERQQYQAMLAQREIELERVRMAEMDDYQQLEYKYQQAQQQLQFVAQEREREKTERGNREIAERLSRVTGAPVEELLMHATFEDALDYAESYKTQLEQQREKERQAELNRRVAERAGKVENNRVDLGSGAPVPANDWDREYQALKSKKPLGRDLFAFALDKKQG